MLSVDQSAVSGAVLWLTLAIFGADMTLSPSWSTCIDIGGRNAGQVSGTMNMAGNLGSALVALAFPYLLLWTGEPQTFFHLGAAFSAVAIGCWAFIQPRQRIVPLTA
jgi:ACS family glucarate transporter-like MFS transporter